MNFIARWCQLPYLKSFVIVTLLCSPLSAAWDVPSVRDDSKQCAELYFQRSFQGPSLNIKDDEQFLDLTDILHHLNIEKATNGQNSSDQQKENELTPQQSSDGISFRVQEGCNLKLSPTAYLKDGVHMFLENVTELDEFLPRSAACQCPKACKCEDAQLRRSECARAYLNDDCTNCKALFTTMKPSESLKQFPQMWSSSVHTIILREGCNVSLKSTFGGKRSSHKLSSSSERIIKHAQQIGNLTNYHCHCSEFVPKSRANASEFANKNDPILLNIPKTKGRINTLLFNKELTNHPGLMAALQSLRNKRSSENAYILLLGLTGSGKSSAVNLLFDHPNVTKVGDFISTTTDILEFSIPVSVPGLGMNNTALHVIDTPGIGDTRGIAEDARFLASLDDFLNKHDDLRRNLPNVVLIFSKFSDNRYRGDGANFVKMLRTIDLFKDRIIDKKATNVIFVLTHYMSETKDLTRDPSERIKSIRKVIQEFSTLPRPIHIVLAENKPEESHLPSVNGFHQLPNGEFYPKNLFDQMQRNLINSGDPVGEAIIRSAFSNSDNFQIFGKRSRLLHMSNAKVTKYLGTLASLNTPVSGTEVSTELNKVYEQMDPVLKSTYSDALNALQRALFLRNIIQVSDLPKIHRETLKLLENIQINPATTFLLENAFNMTIPQLKTNLVVGSGYSLISDSSLPSKIFKTEIITNDQPSDLLFKIADAYRVELLNQLDSQFQVFSKMENFIGQRMKALGLSEDTIPYSAYKSLPSEHPGFNMISLSNEGDDDNTTTSSSGFSWNSLSAIVDYHIFHVGLSKDAQFSDEFSTLLGHLEKLNLTDSMNVANWLHFFDRYGTHVVTHAFGGGSIKVTTEIEDDGKTSNEKFAILSETMANIMQELANELLGKNAIYKPPLGVKYGFSQRGGDHKYFWSNFSDLDDTKNIDKWKDSLKYDPVVLTSRLQLLPISEIVKEANGNQDLSYLIEEAASTLFNASLIYIPIQRFGQDDESPESRDMLKSGAGQRSGDFESMQEFAKLFKMITETSKQMQEQLIALTAESQQKQLEEEAKRQENFFAMQQKIAEKERVALEDARYQQEFQLKKDQLAMERLQQENALKAEIEKSRMQMEMQQRILMEEQRSKSEQAFLSFINLENDRRAQIAMGKKGWVDKTLDFVKDIYGGLKQSAMALIQ